MISLVIQYIHHTVGVRGNVCGCVPRGTVICLVYKRRRDQEQSLVYQSLAKECRREGRGNRCVVSDCGVCRLNGCCINCLIVSYSSEAFVENLFTMNGRFAWNFTHHNKNVCGVNESTTTTTDAPLVPASGLGMALANFIIKPATFCFLILVEHILTLEATFGKIYSRQTKVGCGQIRARSMVVPASETAQYKN